VPKSGKTAVTHDNQLNSSIYFKQIPRTLLRYGGHQEINDYQEQGGCNSPRRSHRIVAQISGSNPKPMNTGVYE
jgi:hypothetical protein